MFSDKLSVDARDVCATINQDASVNNFQHVRGGDELQRVLIAFRVQNTITGAHIKEGELCVE